MIIIPLLKQVLISIYNICLPIRLEFNTITHHVYTQHCNLNTDHNFKIRRP